MKSQLLRVLSIRPFLYLWLSEIFSQIASNMVNFILIVLAYDLSRSNTAVSGIVLSFTVPAIIFGALAGVFVDRSNKKAILFLTNAVRAALLVILAAFHSNLFSIYILAFFISLVTQFFIPAETPMIPLVVDKSLLLSANALFGTGIYASIILGFALSGVFLILFGNIYVFIVLAFFFLIASFFISHIKISKTKEKIVAAKTGSFQSIFKEEIADVITLIAKTKLIYQSIFLLSLSQILILVLAVIGPGFAKQILEIEVNQFSFIFVAPAAFGMIIGAILIGNFCNKYSKTVMTTFGLFLSGISIILLPYSSKVASRPFVSFINSFFPQFLQINILYIVIFLAFILGIANALVFIPSNTILQEETTNQIRGKIYGLLNSISAVASLFPIIIVGRLADIIGIQSVLSGIGFILFTLGAIRIIFR